MAQQQKNPNKFNYNCKVYNFMRWDNVVFSLLAIMLIISITIMGVRGFNWSVDFTGGTVIELRLDKPADLDLIRDEFKHSGFSDLLVQNFGGSRDVIVRMPPVQEGFEQKQGSEVLKVINQATGQNAVVKRVEFIGPRIGSAQVQDGCLALLAALICILIYVRFRFEWRLATGAVLALIHDVVITLGVLSLFQIEIDLTIIASLMSVIGYSLNDSIVVSDRVRENFRKIGRGNSYDIFNISLTQTLSRTIITSATTMIVISMLLIFGGAMLRGFSITLLIGICIGTASSIYVASVLALKLGIKREHLLQ